MISQQNVQRFFTLLFVVIATGCSSIKGIFNNPSKENINPPKALTEFTPTLKVEKIWSTSIGKGAQISGVRLRPAYDSGRLYVISTNGEIAALDAATGKSIWKKSNKLRYSGGPSVANGMLVAGTLDGEVQALNAQDGAERWQINVSSEVIAPPAISGDTVVVRSHDGRIYGLDAKDGARKWVYDRSSVPLLSLRGNSPPIIRGETVFDGADNGKVVALRLTDGAVQWEQTLTTGEGRSEIERLADVDGLIDVESDIVYAVGYRGQAAALLGASGRPLWTREMSSYTGMTLSGDQLYLTDAESNVLALDRRSGSSMWKQDALQYRWLSAPAIQASHLVVGDFEGYVHWLNSSDGALAARVQLTKKSIEAAPVVAGDTVFVESAEGNIAAYRVGQL